MISIRASPTNLALLFIITWFVVVSQDECDAEGDPVYFVSSTSDQVSKSIAYQGELGLFLRVELPENCTSWNIEFQCGLFKKPFTVIIDEVSGRGDVSIFLITIDPESPLGDYHFIIFFNYTKQYNERIKNLYECQIQYRRLFKIVEVAIPNGYSEEFSLTIELFEDCQELVIYYQHSEDIKVEEDRITRKDLAAGQYSFTTTIHQQTASRVIPRVGYRVDVKIANRTISEHEYPIRLHLSVENIEPKVISPSRNIFAILIIIFLIIIVNYIYCKYSSISN